MIISDEMLRENAEKAAKLYLERINSEFEQETEHVFSGHFERKMRKIIKDQKRSPGQRRFISIVQKAAVILLVLLAGTFATTMSVKAYREEFISFIKRVTHRATSIEYRIGDVEYCEVDLSKTVFGYLPEGYEITEQKIWGEKAFYTLKRLDGGTLYVEISVVTNSAVGAVTDSAVGAISIDIENAKVKSTVIKGEEAILSQKTEKTILVCSDRNVICVLGGEDISEDDIIKIGENIVFFFEEHN